MLHICLSCRNSILGGAICHGEGLIGETFLVLLPTRSILSYLTGIKGSLKKLLGDDIACLCNLKLDERLANPIIISLQIISSDFLLIFTRTNERLVIKRLGLVRISLYAFDMLVGA